MAERANPNKWARVKHRLRTELGEDVFNSWFGRVEFEQEDKSTVYLSVPTRFLKSWIMSHYYDRLLALWKTERDSDRAHRGHGARHDPRPGPAAARGQGGRERRRRVRSPLPRRSRRPAAPAGCAGGPFQRLAGR